MQNDDCFFIINLIPIDGNSYTGVSLASAVNIAFGTIEGNPDICWL